MRTGLPRDYVRINLMWEHSAMREAQEQARLGKPKTAQLYWNTPPQKKRKKELQNENKKTDKNTQTCVGDVFVTGVMGRPWYVFSNGQHDCADILIFQDGPLLPLQFLLKPFFSSRVYSYV